MMCKILLVGMAILAIGCNGFADHSCSECFDHGTYRCDPSIGQSCTCHVGFMGEACHKQQRICLDSQCNEGICVFKHGQHQCECRGGRWGRLCEHMDEEVANLTAIETELALKHCGEKNGECEPPHLQVVCSNNDLDVCDENGSVRPYRKCPYPWYCFEAFRNGRCDWECERPECLYDGYECATNRVCDPGCITKAGKCDLACSLKSEIDEYPDADKGSVIIEFSLGISESFWWENMNELIANISEPLRTPLVYDAEYNEELEKKRNTLEKIVSRGRRSISKETGMVVVNLELMNALCGHADECTADAMTAGKILSVVGSQQKLFHEVPITSIRLSPHNQSSRKDGGSITLAVCLVLVVVPIVIIGYRVISAPIWFPPKSEGEVPEVWCTPVTPLNPVCATRTPLHEEAYSLSAISLPINQEYVNVMDEEGRTPLFWLIASKKSSHLMVDDLDELVKAGANPNHSDYKGETAISIAITALRPSICHRLVEWGANPATTSYSGASCLHLAVAQDDMKCVQWLLSFPAVANNINEVDDCDRTPLAMAAQGGCASAQIAEILIEAGADVLHQGNQFTMWRYRGRAALHWAALFNNLEVMKVLLEHRSDVNCVDTDYCTALHLSIQRGSEEAVRMLLEAHASTDIPNGLGANPLSMASKTGIGSLIELVTWYSNVRKEELEIKKRPKKREKKLSDSSESSKRSCSSDSPFSNDSISTHSGSNSTLYFSSSISSDSSSITSGTSITSTTSVSSCPWSPSSSSIMGRKTRPPCLPPIHEYTEGNLSFDSVHPEVFLPPGVVHTQSTTVLKSLSGESGFVNEYIGSFPLSPPSERSVSGGPESPLELRANYWEDEEKSNDGLSNEEFLREFFVNWQH